MKILLLLIPIYYFLENLVFDYLVIEVPVLSSTIIFDLFFSFLIISILRKSNSSPIKVNYKEYFIFFSCISILACVLVYLLYLLAIPVPFSSISYIGIKLLIVAPFIEELVFRKAFHRILKAAKTQHIILISAICFSISHVLPLSWLESAYAPFFIAQAIYTFF